MARKNAVTIKISARERIYLLNTDFLPELFVSHIQGAHLDEAGGSTISISPEMSEQFSDIFTERMAKHGFDRDYKPTAEGKLLEDLIDRFFAEAED